MGRSKKLIVLIACAMLFGFLASVIGALIFALMTGGGNAVKDTLLGSFFGAFCAFLFVRLGEMLSAMHHRVEKHRTALVRLEYWHNELISILDDQSFAIKAMQKVFNHAVETKAPAISANRLSRVDCDREALFSLANLTVINAEFGFITNFRKWNDDIALFNETYGQLSDRFTTKVIDLNTYLENLKFFIEKLATFETFLEKASKRNLRLMAEVRVLLKRNTFYGALLLKWLRQPLHAQLSTEIEDEIEKLREELDQQKGPTEFLEA